MRMTAKKEVKGEWRKLHNEFLDFYSWDIVDGGGETWKEETTWKT